MNIITLKILIRYLENNKFGLAVFASLGLIIGVVYSLMAPKIYEAYIDISLPQVNQIVDGKFNSGTTLITPSVDEIRKFYQNPINISESLLRACSLTGLTNENRKALTAKIFSQSSDPQNSRIAIRVQAPGKEAAMSCAHSLELEILNKSNMQKNTYLNSNPHNNGILNIDAISRGPIVISDAYISPRPFLFTLGSVLLSVLFYIFLTWFRSQWKRNAR